MNSKTFLSKTTSVVASIVLALGGSLVATQPASALSNLIAPAISGTSTVGSTLTASNGTWDTASTTVMNSWYRCNSSLTAAQRIGGPAGNPAGCSSINNAYSSSYTLVQADEGKYISALITYMSSSGSADWFSASTTAVAAAAVTYTVTLNANGGTNGSTTSLTQGSAGASVTLPTTTGAPTKTSCTLSGWATSTQNADAATPTLVSNTYTPSSSLTLYASWACTGGSSPQSNEQVNRSVFHTPILNSLAPKLASGFSSTGGRLVLKDVKLADIKSVTLNDKKVEVIASKSGAAVRLPAGSGAGSLTFTMADGSVVFVANAVTISESQIDPKSMPLDSLPKFSGNSVAVPKAIKTELSNRKAIILDSVSAMCVGYATSNSAPARATALKRASNVCGVISSINENLEPIVKVLVNKNIARRESVKFQTW